MTNEILVSGASAGTSPSDPIPSATIIQATATDQLQTTGRLTKIEISNYRGFRGRFELDLHDGCNLIIYGENGAGKSSLFNALSDFLESPDRKIYDVESGAVRALKCDDNRHYFCKDVDDPAIRLSFRTPSLGGNILPNKIYEWTPLKNDSYSSEMRTVNKVKGCLDYKCNPAR